MALNFPGPYDAELNSIARREKMAQLMQQQALQPLEINSFQGFQAPISPLQGIAKVLQMYIGSKQTDEAEQARQLLGLKAQTEGENLIAPFVGGQVNPKPVAVQPTTPIAQPAQASVEPPVAQAFPIGASGSDQLPAVSEVRPTGTAPTVSTTASTAASTAAPTVAPQKDIRQLVRAMMNPYAAPVAKILLEQELKNIAPTELSRKLVEAGYPVGSPEYQTFMRGTINKEATQSHVPGSVIQGPQGIAHIPKTSENVSIQYPSGNLNAPVAVEVPNAADITSRQSAKVAGSEAIARETGTLAAKELAAMHSAAQNAQTTVDQANKINDLIASGAFAGATADIKLQLAKLFNVAGADNNEVIKNTEVLISQLGQNVLNSAKTSGLGTGQGFTDKDKDFLEKVVGGSITLNAETLKELGRISKDVAQKSVSQWNSRFDKMSPDIAKNAGWSKVELSGVHSQADIQAELRRRGLIK
jgi:negative regulator of replication initiation